MSRFYLCLLIGLLVAAVTAPLVAGCSNCATVCLPLRTVLLQTEGYLVVSVDSSCSNASTIVSGSQVIADAIAKKATCHFDVMLDDGEKISLDVPFTKDAQECCCGGCTTVATADWTAFTISAPPGYVPHIDASADAADDVGADAAEEPVVDASDQ